MEACEARMGRVFELREAYTQGFERGFEAASRKANPELCLPLTRENFPERFRRVAHPRPVQYADIAVMEYDITWELKRKEGEE